MGFLQDNRFKLKQAFAAAAMCGLTAAGVLASGVSTPLSFLACVAGGYFIHKVNLEEEKEIAANIVSSHSYPVAHENDLLSVVKKLSKKAGIRTPKIRMSAHDKIRIAAAVGEDTLLVDYRSFIEDEEFTREELECVVAHEIGHLRNRDLRSGNSLHFLLKVNVLNAGFQAFDALTEKNGSFEMATVAAVATVGLLAYTFRQQEFEADRMAARLTGSGVPLTNAFDRMHRQDEAQRSPAGFPGRLLATHPPFPDRIASLKEEDQRMAAEQKHLRR